MSFVKLRTLTLKSKMKFGRHFESSVKDMFTLGKADYLVWAYYNLAAISFCDEILDKLEIEKRIDKPGVDKEYYEANKETLRANVIGEGSEATFEQKRNQYYINKKIKKDTAMIQDRSFNSKYSKGALQYQNHKR